MLNSVNVLLIEKQKILVCTKTNEQKYVCHKFQKEAIYVSSTNCAHRKPVKHLCLSSEKVSTLNGKRSHQGRFFSF